MIKPLISIASVSAAVILFAFPAAAATVPQCLAQISSRPSYAWDFQREANRIFQSVEHDARQALEQADTLKSFEGADSPGWKAHIDQLNQIKAQVNRMADRLCRLEALRPSVEPWQQKTITSIAGTLQLMADNTSDAILFIDSNQNDLRNSTYQQYVNNLCNQANALTQTTDNAVEYGKVLKQYRHFRREFGLKSS